MTDPNEPDPATESNQPALQLPDRTTQSSTAYLEAICSLFQHLSSAKTFPQVKTAIEKHFAPVLPIHAVEPILAAESVTKELLLSDLITYCQHRPDYEARPFNISAQVNEDSGRAVVFTTSVVSGIFPAAVEISKETVVKFLFRRKGDDEWICTGVDVMRGPGVFMI